MRQAKLKSRWAALEKVVGAEPRIASEAADPVAHFEERSTAQSGKAMVVGMSRRAAPKANTAVRSTEVA